MTKELRDLKKKVYVSNSYLDERELEASWFQEDEPTINYKELKEALKNRKQKNST